MLSRAKRLLVSPLAWIATLAFAVRVVGIGWGLPASDGWDNDGVAPRDFLAGLVETLTPEHFYTYPPVHLFMLAVLTAPITVVALVRAPSLSRDDVIHEILKVPYMTANAYVARGVSLVMSIASIVLVARIAEELRAVETGNRHTAAVRRAGYCAAAFAATNVAGTYYAHTSNLDTPYLFWSLASLLVLVRALARQELRLLRRAFVFAVLAIGSKDQAYGLFLVSVPIATATFVVFDPWARTRRREVLHALFVAAGLAFAVFLVTDAVVLNPAGFRARLEFLSGPASKDFVTYSNDWVGRARMLRDAAMQVDHFYPAALALVGVAGILLAMLRAGRHPARLATTAMPLLAALSFTVTFNFAALRTDHRFFLPQSLLLAVYGGLALERLLFVQRKPMRALVHALVAVPFAVAIHRCLAVDAQLLYDPRYAAEAWLTERVRGGELVETYGNNVYQPRFPAMARVARVGPEPVERRNPLPGVTELQAPFEDVAARGPRFVVLPGGWLWRYLIDPKPDLDPGKVLAPTQAKTLSDERARSHFTRFITGADEYGMAKPFKFESRFFPLLDIHASTSREVWIYERKSAP